MIKVVKRLSVAVISRSNSGSTGSPFCDNNLLISWANPSHTRTIGTDSEISKHSVNTASFKSFLVTKRFWFLRTASMVNCVRGTKFIRLPSNYVLMKTLWHSWMLCWLNQTFILIQWVLQCPQKYNSILICHWSLSYSYASCGQIVFQWCLESSKISYSPWMSILRSRLRWKPSFPAGWDSMLLRDIERFCLGLFDTARIASHLHQSLCRSEMISSVWAAY